MKSNVLLNILCSVLCSVSAFADIACEQLKKDDLVKIILSKHPDIGINSLKLKEETTKLDLSKKILNPNFSASIISGVNSDGDFKTVSLNLIQKIEIAGKRASKIEMAKFHLDATKNKIHYDNENIVVESIMKTYRYKQINELVPIYTEAIKVLSEVLNKKIRRKSLSPEETVEKESLELEIFEINLSLVEIKSELEYLTSHLQFYLDSKCEIAQLLTGLKFNWVDLSNIDMKKINNFKVKELELKLEAQKSNLELEKKSLIPDLEFGPQLEVETINGKDYKNWGFHIGFEVPIFNYYTANKQSAKIKFEVAGERLRNYRKEFEIDTKAWILRYSEFKKQISLLNSLKKLEKNHDKIENLFQRGTISVSTLVESHRKLIDYLVSKHKFEMKALEAQLRIEQNSGELIGVDK